MSNSAVNFSNGGALSWVKEPNDVEKGLLWVLKLGVSVEADVLVVKSEFVF